MRDPARKSSVTYREISFLAAAIALSSLNASGLVESPVFNPGEGDSATVFPVTVTCATAGASIHYTLNGSEPTVMDPSVASGGSIKVARNLTLKAKAWSGGEASVVTTAVYGLTGAVAAGAHHVLALSSNGEIHAWGEQTGGRLGNGLTGGANVSSPTVAKYSSLSPIGDGSALGAGLNHSVFVSGGGVWAFGANGDGQLGNNSTTNSGYAVRVRKSTSSTNYLTNCIAAYAGNYFSAAVDTDGYVYTWGVETGGRLGNGNIANNRAFAGRVKKGGIAGNPDLTGIVGAALGGGFALAREANSLVTVGASGRVWAWGHGGVGQLGSGGTGNRSYAYPVLLNAATELTDAWDVSAGESHGVIVRWKSGDSNLQGSVWTFGQRGGGRLGNNSTATGNVTYPVQVVKSGGSPLDHITIVAAGSAHTLALDDQGRVWAWGENGFGAVGDSTTTDRGFAVPVKNPDGAGQLGSPDDSLDPRKIVMIAAGGDGTNNTSFAIAEDGKVYAWGRNDDGELGSGTTSTGATPLPQLVPNFAVVPGHPDVALSHSVNSSQDPGNVTLTATPSDPDGIGDVEKVEFYSQGSLVGQVVANPWRLELSNLSPGTYHVYAVVTDDDGHQGHSNPVTFTIHNSDPHSDLDEDGLSYSEELVLGTDPLNPDTDGDRMGDGYEAYYHLSPLSAGNSLGQNLGPQEDKDADGMLNIDEFDRGRIPTSNIEEPTVTGSGPNASMNWFGVVGVNYHIEHSTGGVTWARHPQMFVGGNAELSVLVSSVVNPTPTPLNIRIVAESDAPDVSLSATVGRTVYPGEVALTASPVDPDGAEDILKVQFFSGGSLIFEALSPPWTYTLSNILPGEHEVYAVVVDQMGKRGFSNTINFEIDEPDLNVDDDHDGLPDYWEYLNAGTFAAWPASLEETLFTQQTAPQNFILNNDTPLVVNYTVSLSGNYASHYSYLDSLTGGASFDWEEISSTGNLLQTVSIQDDGSQQVSIAGFDFPFFGVPKNQVYVSSNGLLTFDGPDTTYTNVKFPGASAPLNAIAPFWDDLNPSSSGEIYYKSEASRFIIQYDGVALRDGTGTCTFQVVLHASGRMDFRYKALTGNLAQATIGLQNSAGTAGLGIIHNTPYAADNLAITIWPLSEFFGIATLSGAVPARAHVNLEGAFRSLSLPAGIYEAQVLIAHDGAGASPTSHNAKLVIPDRPATVDITSPFTGSNALSGDSLLLRAEAVDPDGLAKVEFYAGTTKIGEVLESESMRNQYNFHWIMPSPGLKTIVAKTVDILGGTTNSTPILVNAHSDTDGDLMGDEWETTNGLNAASPLDANLDSDNDGLTNLEEYLNATDPQSSDSDSDGLPDGWETENGTNPRTNDAAVDLDKDGLTNFEEYQKGTKANDFDSDDDRMPDGWEDEHGLNPLDAHGLNEEDGASGDREPDGLSNLEEYLHGTNPNSADSDSDGINDGIEVGQGGDPTDGGDGGAAPGDSIEEVEFLVGGDYASWRMEIKALGPRDNRTLRVASPAPGSSETKSHKLWRNNRYEITMHHTGSRPEDDPPWYCWEGKIENQPSSATFESLPDNELGARTIEGEFFVVKKHWLVDNREGVLTPHLHSKGSNHITGKKAYLTPVEIGDNLIATGVDDVSMTATPGSEGYQEYSWIMAPAGGVTFSNDMYFKIPLDPPAILKMSCPNATIDPTSVSLDLSSWQSKAPVITWRGLGGATSDNTPEFKLGANEKIVDLPIRVKTMKRRTVNVALYPVAKDAGAAVRIPSATVLNQYLNEVYEYQTNAQINLIVRNPAIYDYDVDNDGVALAYGTDMLSMMGAIRDPSVQIDLHVFVIDRVRFRELLPSETSVLRGVYLPTGIIINGADEDGVQQLPGSVFNWVVAHEMGHGIVGLGHPDQGFGAAPLPGTDHVSRLMYSGAGGRFGSKLLVKSEWDAAEEWYQKRPRGDN